MASFTYAARSELAYTESSVSFLQAILLKREIMLTVHMHYANADVDEVVGIEKGLKTRSKNQSACVGIYIMQPNCSQTGGKVH